MDQRLSKIFDFLRFPLSVFVVYLHISPVVSTFEEIKYTNNFEMLYVYLNALISKISNLAVPLFFLISGYLLVINIKRLDWSIYKKKLSNRFKTLFIPYILWNIIAVCYLLFTKQINDFPSFQFVFIKPANFPLWFLRDLMILVAVFPLFYGIFKRWSKLAPIVFTLFFILYPIPSMSIRYILIPIYFFSIGIYGGIYRINLTHISHRLKIITPIIFTTLLISELIFTGLWSKIIDNLYMVTGVLSILLIVGYLMDHHNLKSFKLLSSCSFFIFCAHKIGPTFISKYWFEYIPIDYFIKQTVIYIISPILSVLICVLIYKIGNSICPKYFKILTGGK